LKIIFTSDWHLSEDSDQNYRFDVIERLLPVGADKWYILGDIFDKKGNHSPLFVDKVLHQLNRIPVPVVVVAGNHDGFTPENNWCRIFRWLTNVLVVCGHPQTMKENGFSVGFSVDCYPFGSSWDESPKNPGKIAVFHGMVCGSRMENGMLSPRGISPEFFSGYDLAIGGDVHVSQKIGRNIVYAGAPHHLHFGDTYGPRVLVMDTESGNTEWFDLPVRHEKCIVRWDPSQDVSRLGLPRGSFVRVRSEHEIPTEDRESIAKAITENGWIIDSIQCEPEPYVSNEMMNDEDSFVDKDPKLVLDRFCSQNDISDEARQFMVGELEAELCSNSKV
jgi:DNA repair exonuclease SbcCD nuclease subunit